MLLLGSLYLWSDKVPSNHGSPLFRSRGIAAATNLVLIQPGAFRMESPQTKRTGSPSQELWKGFFIGTIKSEANDTEHQPLYGQKYLA
jgi:tRNA(Leu) C34 or U34 (ribose-2'-O)-methylase TrmL